MAKNLVGSYYAPIRIIVDTDVLQTLEDWLLPDGMGEIVKHALCQDVDLLTYLEEYDGALNDPVFLDYIVRRTIELKCEVIDIDPKENKEAVVLIYGHTLGHPIESISHRMGTACCLSHGQAVAIGCVIAARVAFLMGLAEESIIERTEQICAKYDLPYLIPADQSVDRIMSKLPFNKTWTKEGTMMALIERPGKVFNFDGHFKCPVDDATIRRAVEQTMAPFGTIIKGSGSSGALRKNKLSNGDLASSTITTPIGSPMEKPGEGWAVSAGGSCPKGDC
uniref:3-dehydroquinate synthase C-terminal domain-containing protein n=1 Tax=Florenciella parvula TaxID=236787 RepID=A0A7S2B695_9STRA|mmetsp:Transcript_13148/g.27791  ORF Transcript_13148/g.27791 Transcript_13148/m.27791 type:complete len:279 (+) Transcript_13148:131-967(+)